MRRFSCAAVFLAACGGPEPSIVDPRFDELRWTSSIPIDGDLNEAGDLVTLTGRFGPLTTGDADAEVAAFVAAWDPLLAVSAESLVAAGVRDGPGGARVARFGVRSGDLPVFDAFLVGEVVPPHGVTYLASRVPADLEVTATPSVTAEEALSAAADAAGLDDATPTGDPVLGVLAGGLYLDEELPGLLAWQVPVVDAVVYVDAVVGDVVWVSPDLHDALDLDLYDAGHSRDRSALLGLGGQPATRVPWMNEAGALPGATPSAGAQRAFEHIGVVHAWYEDKLGYTGIDGAGIVPTAVYVHYGETTYRNAHFSLNALWIGDPVNHLDVMAHEYTHGVVRFTAGLVYAAYSGALNESIADSFAAFVDTGEKWQMGEDIEGGPLRYFDDPGRKGHPDHWKKRKPIARSGACRDEAPRCDEGHSCLDGRCLDLSKDHGWVHRNSGIPNHATWLMAAEPVGTVRRSNGVKARSIGQDKVAPVMMDVLQIYLGPSGNFGQYARSMVAACKGYVRVGTPGFETKDCGAMINALHAVGIHKGPDTDEDTVVDDVDGCPKDYDPEQEDADGDRVGDACDDTDGTRVTVVARHSHSGDPDNIHIVLQGEPLDDGVNRVTPGATRVRKVDARGELTVGVGRGGSVWQTISCGPAIEDGEYEAVYHEGFGLQAYGFDCWRTGPGLPPPDPTEPAEPAP